MVFTSAESWVHVHGFVLLIYMNGSWMVVIEIANLKESKSFMCFVFCHSICYLNLFLNVLNMRTNLPLGEVTVIYFLGVFKWSHSPDARRGVPLFTRQRRKWSLTLTIAAWFSLLLVPIDCTNRRQGQQHVGPDVPLISQLLLLISLLWLFTEFHL